MMYPTKKTPKQKISWEGAHTELQLLIPVYLDRKRSGGLEDGNIFKNPSDSSPILKAKSSVEGGGKKHVFFHHKTTKIVCSMQTEPPFSGHRICRPHILLWETQMTRDHKASARNQIVVTH